VKQFPAWLTRWMQAYTWIAGLIIVVSAICLTYMAFDRAPPYKLLHVEPVRVHAGQSAVFESTVWRDESRDCSGTDSRFLIDQNGHVQALGEFTFSDNFVDQEEAAHTGKAYSTIPIPADWPSGPSVLKSVLMYRCNITQSLWPIEVTVSRPFEVLPP
jgi:hypothetical protein